MKKVFFALMSLCWLNFAYSQQRGPSIVRESLTEAEEFNLKSPLKEKSAKRNLAGEKINKRKKVSGRPEETSPYAKEDSKVDYWPYAED